MIEVADQLNVVLNFPTNKAIIAMKFTFENSPVIELVLGIQLDNPVIELSEEIEIFNILKNTFPNIIEVQPLASIIENVDAFRPHIISNNWISRKHYINKENDRLIQLQPDRLLFNWRKESEKNKYPKYETVFNAFKEIINKVEEHLKRTLVYNQFEITYVDHILLDLFNLKNYSIPEIFSFHKQDTPYNNMYFKYTIPMETIGGVMHIDIKSAIKNDTKEKIIILESTCRGFNPNMKLDDWFSKAHQLLLEHFISIITENAKSRWGYKEK
ncbi:MAG: TIGR04255 family protein [Candidatus Marinimicrobia bacterium]|nr:TIGR04255 family protein [Candidatus Neomarinimicrobiota bacterium]